MSFYCGYRSLAHLGCKFWRKVRSTEPLVRIKTDSQDGKPIAYLGSAKAIRFRQRDLSKTANHHFTMMMTFITRRGEGQGKMKKERKATKSEGRGLEEGASRALMRQHIAECKT